MTDSWSAHDGNFLERHRLPTDYRDDIERGYRPLASWIHDAKTSRQPVTVGLSGAQGTGKSTVAAFLQSALARGWRRRVAILSLDDFYLTRDERRALANRVHPLLATRGVPGTHDLPLLERTLAATAELGPDESIQIPQFDKLNDDRSPESVWPGLRGPFDIVILEGWCVGARPQAAAQLTTPVNALEREHDAEGRWRRYVNQQLAGAYQVLFERLDALVFLAAPDMDCVRRWRLEQERRAAAETAAPAHALATPQAVRDFVMHFERITRQQLEDMPTVADAVVSLTSDHRCAQISLSGRAI